MQSQTNERFGSSVWLEYLPVTQGVASSSLVRTARQRLSDFDSLFCFMSKRMRMIVYPNFKINIGLNIVRKRADGYHDLQTVFYPVDTICDELEINKIGSGLRLTVQNVENLCADEDNLCVKAFRLLQKHYPIDGVDIRLKKNIPFGAGLGGGSADAAFAIKVYNQLFNLDLTNEQLRQFVSQLGSDTAFFIDNSPAFAQGRGEIMKPINLDLSDYKIEIVKPEFSISTKEAYAGVTPHPAETDLMQSIQQPIEKWKTLIHNDFEDSLFVKYPQLQEMKQKFYDCGALYASLSGSGSAVYGIFRK